MTSHRKQKQKARALGLSQAELALTDLLGEVLELLRWNQVLGYSNQFLLHEKLGLSLAERKAVMAAAAAAVEQDGRMQEWTQRLGAIQDTLRRIDAQLRAGTGPAAAASAEAGDGD